jgi:hypothetical protein
MDQAGRCLRTGPHPDERLLHVEAFNQTLDAGYSLLWTAEKRRAANRWSGAVNCKLARRTCPGPAEQPSTTMYASKVLKAPAAKNVSKADAQTVDRASNVVATLAPATSESRKSSAAGWQERADGLAKTTWPGCSGGPCRIT